MKRLRQLRTSKNLTQKDVAEFLGVDRTTYVKYETGASEPNFETLQKLAAFFGVSTDYLLNQISIHVPQVGHDSKQSQKLLAKNISTDKSVNSSPHN